MILGLALLAALTLPLSQRKGNDKSGSLLPREKSWR
jgi:hypothetical protein